MDARDTVTWLVAGLLLVTAGLPLPASAEASRQVVRLAGADRFDTAARASSLAFPDGADTVHVANGGRFVDALAAGPSAAREVGPLLLVTTDGIPAPTARELARLEPSTVVVSGGPQAVSDDVARKLADSTGADVRRVAGADRFETAAAFATGSFRAPTPVVFVASGVDFPDALAGGPAAARSGGPLLLSTSGSLPGATADALERLGPERIVVLGGPTAISSDVLDALRAFTTGRVERHAGATRIDTAVAISRAAFPAGAPVAYLATGADFPDALGGGPAAARQAGPLLLVHHGSLPSAVADELERLKPERVVILGGTNAVSERVAVDVANRSSSSTGDPVHGIDVTDANTGLRGAGYRYDPASDIWSHPQRGPLAVSEGSVTTTHDGQVIEHVQVHGMIVVKHRDVTIRNVRVLYSGEMYGIDGLRYMPSDGNLWVEYSEIEHVDPDTGYGANGVRAKYATVVGNNLHGNWGTCIVHHTTGGSFNNFCRELTRVDGAHTNGIALERTSGVGGPFRVVGNRTEGGTTATITMFARKGPFQDVIVADNFLSGGTSPSYCFHGPENKQAGDGTRDIQVTGNVFDRDPYRECGQYGPYRHWNGDRPGARWCDNRFTDGETIGEEVGC